MNGTILNRDLEDGHRLSIIPLTFGRVRLVIGRIDEPWGYDDGW
jgi:hypothetical protein